MVGTWNADNDNSIRHGKPRIDTARKVADVILNISSATNGQLSQNLMKI